MTALEETALTIGHSPAVDEVGGFENRHLL
jgi:hypothetical protein